MDKQNVVHTYNGILFNFEKEGDSESMLHHRRALKT